MSAFDYVALLSRIVQILRNDQRLRDIATLDGAVAYITDDPEYPTTDQCPAVQVAFAGFIRQRARNAARVAGATPYNETGSIALRCVAFSAQSAADARRQRQELARVVESVLDDHPTLQDTVQLADVLAGEPGERPNEDGSCYADLTLRLEILALT